MRTCLRRKPLNKVRSFLWSFLLFSAASVAAVEIDQQPLLVAKPVPGNMAIIGSFEFPTMVTRAYKSAYSTSGSYVGYFDSGKCYAYHYSAQESERHFYPVNNSGPVCSGSYWSGQYLNWATMQSIDIFRHILTGGYRHKDTPTETWLEKGVQTGQGNATDNFPDAVISGTSLVSGATPFSWSGFRARIGVANIRMGNKMRFSSGNISGNVVDYNPDSNSFDSNVTYELSVRVKVCDATVGLEDNCKPYSQGSKPEGLIQDNSDNMRYAAFGYINDNSGGNNNRNREGGIMHSRMKYVGPEEVTTDNTYQANPRREWDPQTGVFIANPDPDDAAGTPMGSAPAIQHSGVISYINNSGMIVDGTVFKRYDNVSELYYTAYRYIKNKGNVSAYTSRPAGMSDSDWAKLVGGLPIITDWYPDGDDPLQFSCQKTFFLGIGDTNTHADGLIPKAGDDVDAAGRLAKISTMEGGGLSLTGASNASGYIAGLAYDAHTVDLREDLEGKQTISTYWIDILETGLKSRKNNPYWLAAKYGGFRVPEDFDPDTRTAALPTAWWHTNGQTLSNNDLRPDNFYVVSSAQDMVDSLTQAFINIQTEQRGNRSSLALNSTVLRAGVATFQAEYTSGAWTGNLNAYTIDEDTGSINLTPAWSAASRLPDWDARNIHVGLGTGEAKGLALFRANNAALTTELRRLLTDAAGVSASQSNALIEYLRGKRDGENSLNGFRVRQGVLGDIINSQPVYVGAPGANVFRNRSFQGSNSYATFVTQKSGRTPVVYVGGNDGMLHGFNATVGQADSGKEIFAYIPHTVVKNGLGELARRDYEHRYFVDGELTVADAYDGTNWRTVLVGTLGAGGLDEDRETSNAVFALDVTDPSNISLLWEVSSAELPELGINLGKPVIAQVANGVWKVLLGNGPNSNDGTASLISIDVFSGSASAFAVSADADNGLSAVRAWDSDSDGFTDTAYAGDLKGNLWKITGLGGTPSATILFTTAEGQPITAMPLMGRSPYSRQLWLFFGTGQYLNTGDLSDTTIQSWYGIKEAVSGATRDDLLERKILADVDVGNGITARVIEEGAREDLNEKAGWYIDLAVDSEALGERMVTANQFQGSALIGNTRIPDASDPCAPTGRGVIMAIDPFTGARLHDSYFDLDGDRQFTSTDMVMVNGELVPVSGIGLDTGFSNPSFLEDKMFIPTDDGRIRELDINPFSTGVGRTSWRELINTGR